MNGTIVSSCVISSAPGLTGLKWTGLLRSWLVVPDRRREEETQARQKLCSLSKSRKKFGPCSSSVQVSTFNRFPIWILEEKKREEKKGREREREVCGVLATVIQ